MNFFYMLYPFFGLFILFIIVLWCAYNLIRHPQRFYDEPESQTTEYDLELDILPPLIEESEAEREAERELELEAELARLAREEWEREVASLEARLMTVEIHNELRR
uniref:Ribosome maturation factor RimP n=1 Tax=Zeugodacus cucurbitae TaxID=28588 RepID=A0A0A1XD65_ZEUCU